MEQMLLYTGTHTGGVASDVVQFRQDAETVTYLRKRGINPNEFGKEAFEAYLRRLQAEESVKRLAKIKARLPRPIERIIREQRDSR